MKNLIYKSRFFSFLYFKHIRPIFFRNQKISYQDINTTITVVIPAVDKDAKVLPYTIRGILKNLRHEVDSIIVVAPIKSTKIRKVVNGFQKTQFVSEQLVSPVLKKDLNYKVGEIDRSGWIVQQLVKLNIANYINTKKYLVIDADTVLAKPQTYIRNNCDILLFSDEFHKPYRKHIQKTLGFNPSQKISFVSHSMIFDTNSVKSMFSKIEMQSRKRWYKAIIDNLDKEEVSSMSEYEMYASYKLKTDKQTKVEYWFNSSISRKCISKYPKNMLFENHKLRSISFHSYK